MVTAYSSFSEYERFEGSFSRRKSGKLNFIQGIENVPDYDYPELDGLYDIDEEGYSIEDRKQEAHSAILRLESYTKDGTLGMKECDLYASYHARQLKKIMLVEAARRMLYVSLPSFYEYACSEFMALNRMVYGEMDDAMFAGIMKTEQDRVANFTPTNQRAGWIKRSLDSYFLAHSFMGQEASLFNKQLLAKFHHAALRRYDAILSVVPDTADDVLYDDDESRDIMQQALEAGGLARKGWAVELDRDKSIPSTEGKEKKILLPVGKQRPASQIRRLIIHEQEVHARRAQNGIESGLSILGQGTAKYADVEEGLGVLMECVIDGNLDNSSYYRARDRYITAGIALGLDSTPKDGRATFSLLWRLIALRSSKDGSISKADEKVAKIQAMAHTENAFRGTNFAMPGVIYTKLKIYYEGLMKNVEYFTEHAADLDPTLDLALSGKYDHTDKRETETIKELLLQKNSQLVA